MSTASLSLLMHVHVFIDEVMDTHKEIHYGYQVMLL